MTAALLDGKTLAKTLQQEIAQAVLERKNLSLRVPGLAVILINDSDASETYVQHKRRACQRVDFQSFNYDLARKTTESELIALIDELNHATHIDGILIQLPLPKHIDTSKILECIRPDKDVDGFHPYNLGRLAQRHPFLRPCTPFGIMQLLKAHEIPITGQHAVIVGASNIVGRPMALEMLMENATVTVCHRATRNLKQHIQMADILIIATGTHGCIDINWLHKNQVVVDVGIHRLDNGTLCGDLAFEATRERVAWISPVPGGVGPMTITALLQNTLMAAKCHTGT